MTYDARETSVHDGEPVELYRFAHGLAVYTYTSAESDRTYNGETYRSEQIDRGDVELTNEQARNQLEITMRAGASVPALFVSGPPASRVSITVYRYHAGDGETVVIWKGRVGAVEWSGSQAKLVCQSNFADLKRPAIRDLYSRACRHALYSPLCTVDRDAWVDDVAVSAVSGADVTLVASGRASGWYAGGYVQRANGERRMVRAHSGLVLTLLSAMPGLDVGETLQAYAGCDHTTGAAGCAKFSNLDNFGGFVAIPTKNPFGGGGIL